MVVMSAQKDQEKEISGSKNIHYK